MVPHVMTLSLECLYDSNYGDLIPTGQKQIIHIGYHGTLHVTDTTIKAITFLWVRY